MDGNYKQESISQSKCFVSALNVSNDDDENHGGNDGSLGTEAPKSPQISCVILSNSLTSPSLSFHFSSISCLPLQTYSCYICFLQRQYSN